MSTPPSFSIIVPAYNAEEVLGECLDSIGRLDPPPHEVIVVDDASIDATAAIARSKGVKLVSCESNVGQGVARNRGAALATGEFLAFTDSDCVVPENWLANFAEVLSDGNYCGVTGPYTASSVDDYFPQLIDRWLRYNQQSAADAVESSVTANLAMARADFEAIGGFPEYCLPWSHRCCVTNEDEEIAHLLARHSGKLLRWQTGTGVLHAYRPSLRAFLTQQANYTRSLLISRARFPSLLRAESHISQGRGAASVLAAALAALGLCAALVDLRALLMVIPFLAQNTASVVSLARTEPTAARRLLTALLGFPFLLATALAWIEGIVVGLICGCIGWLYWRRTGN